MSTRVRARLVCAALILCSVPTVHAEMPPRAQPPPGIVTLSMAISQARERAPEAIAAMAQLGNARAARAGASVLFTQNPALQIGAGRRFADPRSLAVEGQLSQPLELGRRGARLRAADATIAHAQAVSDAELRELTYEVTTIFYDARFAELAVELATKNLEVAARTVEAAERRRKAGDITDLDVNLARIALGRARSALASAQAVRADAVGRLGAVIGATPEQPITPMGDLRPPALTIDELRAGVEQRADVRALDAALARARADHALATANGRPDLGLWVAYERDDGESIVLGGIDITLPFWNRSQGEKAVARATQKAVELERAALKGVASRQLVDAFEAYGRAREAVEVFERDVAPLLADSEALLQKSVDAGQITINDYLVARQQVLDGRHEHLERQLQLAKAAATARFIAGVTP